MRFVIVDGYTDEPAGLGVPPYIDVYPRYIAGAIWDVDKDSKILYYTIDDIRKNFLNFSKIVSDSDFLIVIAGVVVPGKYLAGRPASAEEVIRLASIFEKPFKILVGPAARFGMWDSSGKVTPPSEFRRFYDLVVRGDPEIVISDLLREGVERVNPYALRSDYGRTSRYAVLGSRIVLQHPNHGLNLIAELETYRGCPRWVTGGCSFCIEPRYGRVVFRPIKDIMSEVSFLYRLGVKRFRVGRQADILAYGSKDVNIHEYPRPNVGALEKLFKSIRLAAPSLEMLHVDNANPMTIAFHKKLAFKALQVIVRWHTPGDVLAFGLESADKHVIKINNLGVDPEMVLEAIRLVNKVGARRGWNGSHELLPGINFVMGLPGESKRSIKENIDFLKKILEGGLLVRRVNIRNVAVLEGTPLYRLKWRVGKTLDRRFKVWVRRIFDREMMGRLYPKNTILRKLYVEGYSDDGRLYARPPGTYPITVFLLKSVPLWSRVDVTIVGYKSRSLLGIPI